MSIASTPLRYPGGKSRLSHYLSLLLRQNGITDCTYVEPFAGGAGAAINLLRREYVRTLYLNDIDRGIFAFWHSVLNSAEDLCRLLIETPITIAEWRSQREVLARPDYATTLELGFAVLFLNRTNRSGIISGGVIGGQQQNGRWRMDARFNRVDLAAKIRRIASYRERIRLFCMDANEFLPEVVAPCKNKVFVYLDPPYYSRGKDLYHDHYAHDNHIALAQTLKSSLSEKPWVISYDNVPQIREAYGDLPYMEYDIGYSAAGRYAGSEIMFFGPKIIRPPLVDPLSIVVHV